MFGKHEDASGWNELFTLVENKLRDDQRGAAPNAEPPDVGIAVVGDAELCLTALEACGGR